MKYRDWLLCGMLLAFAWTARAERLRVDAMSLAPEAAWQRGDAAREREDDVHLLEWPAARGAPEIAVQLAIPRRATPLKTDAEAFYANLRQKWALQYGKRAEIGLIEIGGARWLVCRRPAGGGDAIVFQIVRVHDGRVYSALAFTAPQVTGLPKPVYDLLAAADFGEPPRSWALRRVIAAHPGREALEALMLSDAEQLGRNGMLTGYGIDYLPLPELPDAGSGRRLSWFLEGFKWRRPVGSDERLPLSRRGSLEARAVAGATLAVSLRLASASNATVEAEVGLLELCAAGAELELALEALARGERAPLERLARARPPGCPSAPTLLPPRVLRATPGQPVAQTLTFTALPARPLTAGLEQLRLVFARPRLAGGEDELGQSLLRGLGLYFVHALE